MAVLIRGAHPWGDDSGDVLVRDITIAERGDDLTAPDGADVIDGSGCMSLPGLVDAHTHLDKTLLGTPWRPHDPTETLAEQIANEREVLNAMGPDPAQQSQRMVHHMLAHGTTHVRSHVDVALDIGLRHVEGLAATREA